MKRLAPVLLLAVAALALAADPILVTISELNSKPTEYDTKDVKTTGKVTKFENKTSKAGNPYFKFNLTEPGKGTEIMSINIYGMGKVDPPLKDGAIVSVTGEFKQEKVVSGRKYKMEIEIKPKNILRANDKD